MFQSETLVFQSETLVFQSETLVFQSETLVFQSETLVFQSETLVFQSETLVFQSETLVFQSETLVSRKNVMALKIPKELTKLITDEEDQDTAMNQQYWEPARIFSTITGEVCLDCFQEYHRGWPAVS
ncbi:hypothetical protein AGMMS49942_00510 [Spirochaetia bacterium]|nr:hypothetical protein AGMMS49942_00510 [Spirochaetia bacterium]